MPCRVCRSGWGCIGVLLIDRQIVTIRKNPLPRTRYCSYLCIVFMKKTILLLSFLCYFAVTSGVVINFHYCMKRLASVHLYETAADECGRCGMSTHEYEATGCCRDEVKLVKLEQDQNKLFVTSYDIPALEPVAVIPSVFIVAALKNSNQRRHFHNHSPPLLSEQDTYLCNGVFRI